jgi:hypothetical protein
VPTPLELSDLRAMYPGSLTTLERLFRDGGDDDWADRVKAAGAAWREQQDPSAFLGLFGGMGSINDLVPGAPRSPPPRGGLVDASDRARWFGCAREMALAAAFACADGIRREKGTSVEQALTRPYGAWHVRVWKCARCSTTVLPSDEAGLLVASRVVWQAASEALAQRRPESVGEFDQMSARPEAGVLRASLRRLADQQGWVRSPAPRGRWALAEGDPRSTCPRCGEGPLATEEVRVDGPVDHLEATSRSGVLNADLARSEVPPRVLYGFGEGRDPP